MTDLIVNQQTQIAQGFMANQQLTMSSREIADLTGKRHDHVMVDIRKMLQSLRLDAPEFSGTYSTAQGNEYECFHLPKRETLILISGYSVELRAKIIDRWQELESGVAHVPRTFAEALRLAADKAEEAERLAIERDVAVATKAEIGSRREATAMNTASQAVKQANRMAIALDQSKQYATVKRMSMNYHGQKFDWRLLREVSAVVGRPPIDVFDANYGTVKAYHADAWKEAYAISIEVA